MGAVAYDPKVVTIWDGFRPGSGPRLRLRLRPVLELRAPGRGAAVRAHRRGVELAAGVVRAERLGRAAGVPVAALTMRDTDRDLTSVVVVRADSAVSAVADLEGKGVAMGAVDSPQATLIPLAHLRAAGLEPGRDIDVRRFDVGVGLHGDHIGGERDAAGRWSPARSTPRA